MKNVIEDSFKIITWKELDIDPCYVNDWSHQRLIMQHLKHRYRSLYFEDVSERPLPSSVLEYCDVVIYNEKVLKNRNV